MKNAPKSDWNPDQQLLAAYFDGELEGRDDLADLRARLEAWLEDHPEVVHERANLQQLQKLWLDTTPAEPNAASWNQTLEQIEARHRKPIGVSTSKRPWLAVSVVVASIALFIGLPFGALRYMMPTDVSNDPLAVAPPDNPNKADPYAMEIFPVATAEEVVIRRVEGADTSLLVVGQLPVNGPLELAAPGEVRVVYMRPDVRDQMMPTVLEKGPRPPMIWAKLDTD
jgi:anti-sigma factor RsiW